MKKRNFVGWHLMFVALGICTVVWLCVIAYVRMFTNLHHEWSGGPAAVVAILGLAVSFLGLCVTTFFSIRKERRDVKQALVDGKLKDLQLRKLTEELAELRARREDPKI
ncbi:hypothetical protein QTH97_34130 [Variovorax sp. J22R24]|uniref:hypothetical protein n=1 Tax=Variovorax gracilis TaxID=3053502 RepID=UPI002576CA80|nr:hypothetical protein [Variovorax sp. J22R24]MDM0109990.1 hypothetical protein [Variovorax sp. J22R24]